ncbi:MAG: thioredoxin-disulfide reductase [Candidatus Aminicenantes bacterium]|nr:thioredoxin-disulfide reductase [Candidatus Aminicenantes bacterium]
MNEKYEIIIVGAGPAGMAAAVYTGRARLKTLVLEKGIPGGQILLTDFVENYPGFPEGIAPFELMGDFRKHVEKFGATIETGEASGVSFGDGLWTVSAGDKKFSAPVVIVASGSAYRRINVPGEARLTGRGVSYCATCDGAFFKERDVAIVGGGDHALTEALFLTKFAKSVKVIHRRNKLRGEKILQERVFDNKKIEVVWDSVVEEMSGQEHLEFVTVKNVKTGRVSRIDLEGIFIAVGMDPNSGFVKGVLDLDKWGQIKAKPDMSTSQPGIFAAGDITDICPEQMAIAVGSGVVAALSAVDFIEKL